MGALCTVGGQTVTLALTTRCQERPSPSCDNQMPADLAHCPPGVESPWGQQHYKSECHCYTRGKRCQSAKTVSQQTDPSCRHVSASLNPKGVFQNERKTLSLFPASREGPCAYGISWALRHPLTYPAVELPEPLKFPVVTFVKLKSLRRWRSRTLSGSLGSRHNTSSHCLFFEA